MPPTRRLKTALLLALFATLTIIYVTHGASNTYNSQFYTRTVAAMQTRQDNEAREAMIAEEKTRADRVARIQEEHEQAMGKAKQKPMVEDAAGQPSVKAQEAPAAASEGKPVAGRKMMPDGNGNGGKVVVNPNADDDGVARVGNGGAAKSRESSVASKNNKVEDEESESEHEIEVEMNSILKKGPIIIFSKSYCPFSKKAKKILLSRYTITPPPYVVELDQHPLGAGLQAALKKSTGRSTVPNVLINGKSIGGGDDVAALDETGTLEVKVKELGGKRIMEVKKVEIKEGEDLNGKREVKFKA
ncbi:hypothetical protein Q7P37_001262 [Cladosporium fusiforme]